MQSRHRDHLELKKRGGWQGRTFLKIPQSAAWLNLSAAQLKPLQAALFKEAGDQLEALNASVGAGPYFADLFCGVGGVGRSISRRGYAARLWT